MGVVMETLWWWIRAYPLELIISVTYLLMTWIRGISPFYYGEPPHWWPSIVCGVIVWACYCFCKQHGMGVG